MKKIVGSLAVVALLVGAGCESHKHNLHGQAKVSKAEAERIALEKAPGGTIEEGELEKEHGKLIWSFDISRPGMSGITEVQVDAISGAVVSVENESAEKEAQEKAGEGKEKSGEKDDDDKPNK